MPRKTTKVEFTAFKKSFKRTQAKLGLNSYRVSFQHGDTDAYGEISTCVANRLALVKMAGVVDEMDEERGEWDPIQTGKHEAIHLLLARMTTLAGARYIPEGALEEEEEHLVRTLDRLL